MNKTIDLSINREGLAHNIQKAKENNIIIPTIAQMQNPDLIPEKIKEKLTHTGLWDVDPVNLFRISWHNEAKGHNLEFHVLHIWQIIHYFLSIHSDSAKSFHAF